MKNVCIPQSLFFDLVLYHICEMDEPSERIYEGLNEKMEAILRREYYTQYKTAPDEKEREEARQKYLEQAGHMAIHKWCQCVLLVGEAPKPLDKLFKFGCNMYLSKLHEEPEVIRLVVYSFILFGHPCKNFCKIQSYGQDFVKTIATIPVHFCKH